MTPDFDRTFAMGFIYLGILGRYNFKLTNKEILRQNMDIELLKHGFMEVTDVEMEKMLEVARRMDKSKV